MKKNLKFWAIVVGVSLVPVAAFGQVASDGTDCATTNSAACEKEFPQIGAQVQVEQNQANADAAAKRAEAQRQRKARAAAAKAKKDKEAKATKAKADAEAKLAADKAAADAKALADQAAADAKAQADKAAADAAAQAALDAKTAADKAAADKAAADAAQAALVNGSAVTAQTAAEKAAAEKLAAEKAASEAKASAEAANAALEKLTKAGATAPAPVAPAPASAPVEVVVAPAPIAPAEVPAAPTPALNIAPAAPAVPASANVVANVGGEAVALPATSAVRAAPAAVAAPAAPRVFTPNRAQDLTIVELRKAIPDFDATIEGSNPSSKLRLFGTLPADCVGQFSFTSTANDAELRGFDSAGIRVRDLGLGRACVEAHRTAGHVCERDMECTRLSTYGPAQLDLSRSGDVKVGLIVVNPNSDRSRVSVDNFHENVQFQHVSPSTIATQRTQAIRDQKEARIQKYRDQVQRCRKDSDQLVLARNALGGLASLGALKDGEFERISKELSRAELGGLAKRVDKANEEELSTLREELAAWSSTHPDDGDKAAIVCHKIALKYATKKGAGVSGYDSARETISECQGFEGLSETVTDRLATYQRDISVGRVESLAQQGMQNNFLFAPSWANLMMGMQQDVMSSCSGGNASMEACSAIMSSYRTAAQLPQRAQQIDVQRAQQMQQLQAALGGAGGLNATSMPGQGLWAGGSFGAASTNSFLGGTPKMF